MNYRCLVVAAMVTVLWTAKVAANDPVKTVDEKAASPASALTVAGPRPVTDIPRVSHEFEPVVDGTQITHDFIVRNTGDAPLSIHQVKTG